MLSRTFSLYFAAIIWSLYANGIPASMAGQAASTKAAAAAHRVVFQVTDGDPKKWNMTLINAHNVQLALEKENVAIEIVVYGPAIEMLRIESEVGPLVDEAIKNGVKMVACENTMRGYHIEPADMLPGLIYTRTGVVYLMEKQEEGFSYIRP